MPVRTLTPWFLCACVQKSFPLHLVFTWFPWTLWSVQGAPGALRATRWRERGIVTFTCFILGFMWDIIWKKDSLAMLGGHLLHSVTWSSGRVLKRKFVRKETRCLFQRAQGGAWRCLKGFLGFRLNAILVPDYPADLLCDIWQPTQPRWAGFLLFLLLLLFLSDRGRYGGHDLIVLIFKGLWTREQWCGFYPKKH